MENSLKNVHAVESVTEQIFKDYFEDLKGDSEVVVRGDWQG